MRMFLWLLQALREGVRLLGRVKEVKDFKVMVSLPHGLLGTLPVTAVNAAYTQRLQDVANAAEDEEVEEVIWFLCSCNISEFTRLTQF
jgi:ribosomal protein S1